MNKHLSHLHQQEVTDGQLVTMRLVPATADSDVALYDAPPFYLQGRSLPWTAAEDLPGPSRTSVDNS